MHKIKYYKQYKLNSLQLKLILSQMSFFSHLKKKKIVFNPKPFSNRKINQKNNVNLHIELTKKIDEVLEKNKLDEILKDNNEITMPRFVEIRQPFMRRLEMPSFQTNLSPKADIGEIEDVQEFIEIESPTDFLTDNQQENKNDFDKMNINNQSEKDMKNYEALGALKIRIKGLEPKKNTNNKNNEISLAKIELEETKKEIEKKKKELEEALKREKEKELELKKQEKEKRKIKKLKKLELKKKLKEEKIKEKLAKKVQLELKKKQLEKEIELKQKQIEKEIELKKQELTKGNKNEIELNEEKLSSDILNVTTEGKERVQEELIFDEDVAKLLPILDNLFEKLPEDVVDEFSKSEYFELYEKVLLKYKNK